MKRHYQLHIRQVTNATRDIIIDMVNRCITNDDYLLVIVVAPAADILREAASSLKAAHGKETIEAHVKIKVPFAYRKMRQEMADAFRLD